MSVLKVQERILEYENTLRIKEYIYYIRVKNYVKRILSILRV